MLSFALLGLVVGVMSVFLGLGGGFILVPTLPWLFDIPVKETSAISLATIFIVTSFNSIIFTIADLVNWRVAVMMGYSCALTAFLFSYLAKQYADVYLYMADFVIIFALGVYTLCRTLKMNHNPIEVSTARPSAIIKGGLLAGTVAGISGLGAGTIISPVMIRSKMVSSLQLTPTANACMMFATLAASWTSLKEPLLWPKWGYIDLKITFIISGFAILFSYLLKSFQNYFSAKTKSFLISIILFGISARILLNLYQHWKPA